MYDTAPLRHRCQLFSWQLLFRLMSVGLVVFLLQSTSKSQTFATMTYPAPGATNVPLTGNTFTWTAGSGAQAYYLYVGTAPGLKDVVNSGSITVTSYKVPNFAPATTYYIRLWTMLNGHWASNYVDSTFSTIAGTSVLTFPANGASGITTSPTLTWTSIPNSTYVVNIGSTLGGSDIFNSGTISTTSVQVPGLRGLTTFYVRLFTQSAAGTTSSDSSFTTVAELSQLTFPTNGTGNVSALNPVFTWTSVSDADAYYLYVGSAVGLSDVFNSGSTLGTSMTVRNLAPGANYFARLWTKINGNWGKFYVDTTFATINGANLTFPRNGATNVDPYVTATWNSISGAQSYSLNVGTSLGGSNVYSSGPVTSTSLFIPGLLANTSYYVRLFTQSAGGSSFTDSSFTTGTGIAHLINPAPNSSSIDPFAAFTWNLVSDAQAYTLYVGTQPGLKDVANLGPLPATQSTQIVAGMIGAQTYYATMWTKKAGIWYSAAVLTFQTAPQPLPSDINAWRQNVQNIVASVRGMAAPNNNVPFSGTVLADEVQSRGASYAFCTDFAIVLVQQFMGQRISARQRNVVFTGATFDTHAMTEYYDPVLAKWVDADAMFGIVYFSAASQTGFGVQDISSAVVNMAFTSIPVTYVTSSGSFWLSRYYLDPILLYLNPLPTASGQIKVPLANSPVPYLTLNGPEVISVKGSYILNFASQGDVATISDPNLGVLNLGPENGTSWTHDLILNSGWSLTSQPANLTIYSPRRFLF